MGEKHGLGTPPAFTPTLALPCLRGREAYVPISCGLMWLFFYPYRGQILKPRLCLDKTLDFLVHGPGV
jgi:hypothetical protein